MGGRRRSAKASAAAESHGERFKAARGADRPRDRDGRTDVERQILEITERMLESTSLGDLSVNRICAEAGIARGTFYFYFSSKYAVVGALLARVMDEVYDVMAPFVDRSGGTGPAEALGTGLSDGWRIWTSHRTLMRATCEHWADVPQLQEIWLEIIERFTTAIAGEIEKERGAGIASGGIDSRVLAAMLLWSTERCAYVAGLGVDADLPDEESIFESILVLWLRAIYAETPDVSRLQRRRRRVTRSSEVTGDR
jgi:AcrR family transcriptional regulator